MIRRRIFAFLILNALLALSYADQDPWHLIAPQPWKSLDLYQNTMTASQFQEKLQTIFDPFGGLKPFIKEGENQIEFFSNSEKTESLYKLHFSPSESQKAPHPRLWRTPQEFRKIKKKTQLPLQGLRIAIDPGHIGGKWGPLQNRSVLYPGIGRIQEGDMNLITSKILRENLQKQGAEVFVTRENAEPVTEFEIEDFRDAARERIYKKNPHLQKKYGHLLLPDQDRLLGDRLTFTTQFLFFRIGEIRSRAHKISTLFQPDITIILYINATLSSGRGKTVGVNENIFFIHGCYTKEEATDPEQQVRMVYKILDQGTSTEQFVAEKIANAFQRITGLPPVPYGNSKTSRQLSDNRYVVARNLAANREYDGPVVTTEPYFMNNKYVARRLIAGDYEGTRPILDKTFPSIFREYAEGVTQGILNAYGVE